MAARTHAPHMRWTPPEMLSVASHALPLVEGHDNGPIEAFFRAQQVALPKHRWKELRDITKMTWGGAKGNRLANYLDTVRNMPTDKRPALLGDASTIRIPKTGKPKGPPAPAVGPLEPVAEKKTRTPTGKISTPYATGRIVKWTTREKALLARWIIERRRDHHDKRTWGPIYIAAQEAVLPEDRRRGRQSLYAGTEYLRNDFEVGKAAIWTLDAPTPTEGEQSAPAPDLAPSQAPAAFEMNAPVPGSRQAALSEAARVFGETMTHALDALLAAQAELIMAEMRERVGRIAGEVAMNLQSSIHGMVHQALEKELGPTAPTVVERPAPPPEKLKVDVVGFEQGAHVELVRQAFNGNTELRFVHPDASNTYAPHKGRHIILLAHRIPHSLKHKIKACGVQPIMVSKTPGHVIEAIKALHEKLGTPVH